MIELGPTGGPSGGYIISEHQGGSVFHPKIRFKSVDPAKDFISFTGITHHNLNNIDVSFPFGKITCITGVSGSGKSSVTDIIEEICSNKNYTHCRDFFNVSKIKRVMRVNQQPIGKTPRSTVVSYLGIYDTIREIFSKTERAKELNLTASDFSMNTAGGRCECCQGTGKQKIELTYLPETYITCPECKGYRFKKDVLSVKYNGYSINDILNTPISKLMDIFYDNETISGVLQCVIEIGLGYLSLGQMSMSLSGGEAQRIKLAKSLSVKSRGNGLYILDEPTTGLDIEERCHFYEIFQQLNGICPVLIASHITEDIVEGCTNTIILKNGTVILQEKTKDIKPSLQEVYLSCMHGTSFI